MKQEKPRYTREVRNLLLDRRFQLKYTLVIVLAGGLIFGTMEALFYSKVRENSVIASLHEDAAFANEMNVALAAEDREILLALIGFWLLLVALLFVVGIVATHRIVGPIYVVDRYVRRIAEGHPIQPRPLRRGDEFQTLYHHVNEMADALRRERTRELESIERVLDRVTARLEGLRAQGDGAAEGAARLEAELEPLRVLVREKRAYVTPPAA